LGSTTVKKKKKIKWSQKIRRMGEKRQDGENLLKRGVRGDSLQWLKKEKASKKKHKRRKKDFGPGKLRNLQGGGVTANGKTKYLKKFWGGRRPCNLR